MLSRRFGYDWKEASISLLQHRYCIVASQKKKNFIITYLQRTHVQSRTASESVGTEILNFIRILIQCYCYHYNTGDRFILLFIFATIIGTKLDFPCCVFYSIVYPWRTDSFFRKYRGMQRILSVETSRNNNTEREFVTKRFCYSILFSVAFLFLLAGKFLFSVPS